MPLSLASVSSDERVMPGRIVPPSGGVDHRAVVEDEEDVHAAQLLDPALLDRVEEHDLVAAVAGRFGLGEQAGGVVAAALGGAGAARRGARVVRRHPDRNRVGARS